MATNVGNVIGVNGNMVTVEVDGIVSMNEVGYINVGEKRLKSEVIICGVLDAGKVIMDRD